MARIAKTTGYIRVLTKDAEKARFLRAAKAARQALTQWVIQACEERLEAEGK